MENVKMQYGQKLTLVYTLGAPLASPPRKTDLPVYIIFTNGWMPAFYVGQSPTAIRQKDYKKKTSSKIVKNM